jgi:modified peptide precursor CbpA
MNEQQTSQKPETTPEKKPIIASRRSCAATGIGLSHYILLDRKTK